DPTMIIIWCAFYLSSFSVIIVGLQKSAALEGVVYLTTIVGEAVAPWFFIYLVSRFPESAGSHNVFGITAHFMFKLMSCALLMSWGGVLAFEFMSAGNTPVPAKIYVLISIGSAFATLLWATMAPAKFVGLPAASGEFIHGIWPPMRNAPMSYLRIAL